MGRSTEIPLTLGLSGYSLLPFSSCFFLGQLVDKMIKEETNMSNKINAYRMSQFSSVTQSSLTLCDPMACSMPGLPVCHQLPELTPTHVHWVGDVIQPSHVYYGPSALCVLFALDFFRQKSCTVWIDKEAFLFLPFLEGAEILRCQVTSPSLSR